MQHRTRTLRTWLSTAIVALATYAGLAGLHFSPGWGAALLALGAGALAVFSIDLGVLASIVALSLPLLAASPVLGITFLILGIAALRYLGDDGGRAYFIIAAAVAGAFFGPAWAAAALAGYILGVAEGALAAAIACLAVQALGLSLGQGVLGATVAGGTSALLDTAAMPANMLSPSWVAASFSGIDAGSVDRTLAAFTGASNTWALVLQPVLWAIAAATAGALAHYLRESDRDYLSPLAAVSGAAVPALGVVVVGPLLGIELPSSTVAIALVSSTVVAGVLAFVWDRAFPAPVPASQPAVSATSPVSTVASDDADVDELLRLIATAEDRLAVEHTTTATVLITDMKSFARMTEEDGSVLTAKAIQRHRDLLLPVIDSFGGHGKSTGGDGLVAAFDDPSRAAQAAVEMQRTLDDHNRAHPHERELKVRIGVADGEVVLDKRGRPFIGAALNLAARVMNIAEGGQALATLSVASASMAAVRTHSHGAFALKNLAQPVEVVELLWRDDQLPADPREWLSA
jgi:class 3 adenylate cyclase